MERLKSSFVYLLWLETKVFFVDGLTTIINFLGWVGA